MERTLVLWAAAAVALLGAGARADRLGGNFRGPGDAYLSREDARARGADPSAGLRFVRGLDAGRAEAEFTGKPLLVFLVLEGCDVCRAVEEHAFGDAEVADLASRFVAVRADAEKEEAFGVARAVRTFPTVLALDAKGAEVARAEGPVFPAELAAALRGALRRIGPVVLRRPARDLARASADLAAERAKEKRDWRAILAAVARVERIGHEGTDLDLARDARAEAAAEAATRLDAAKKALAAGRRDEARRAFAAIAREFHGVDEAVEARNLVLEMDGRAPRDGGEGNPRGPSVEERMERADGRFDPEDVAPTVNGER